MPHLMYQNGKLDVLNIQAGHPTNLNYPYRIYKRSEDMKIKEWKKCMDSRKEVLGRKRKRSARIGDKMISFSIMESQGLYCFMLFYLKEGI